MENIDVFKLFKNRRVAFEFTKLYSKEEREIYKPFHEHLKKSNQKFEIQQFHDYFIFPMNHSETKAIKNLVEEYGTSLIEEEQIRFRNFLIREDSLHSSAAEIEIATNINEANKAAAFELVSRSMKGNLTYLGINISENEDLKRIIKHSDDLAFSHQTPSDMLEPKFDTFLYQNMLWILAKNKLISARFLDRSIGLSWINSAFYFGINGDTNIKNSIVNLEWKSSKKMLADWLMFLFKHLIKYEFNNKKEFYNWICEHIEIDNRLINRKSKDFETLEREMKKFNNDFSSNFRLINYKTFEYKFLNPPKITDQVVDNKDDMALKSI